MFIWFIFLRWFRILKLTIQSAKSIKVVIKFLYWLKNNPTDQKLQKILWFMAIFMSPCKYLHALFLHKFIFAFSQYIKYRIDFLVNFISLNCEIFSDLMWSGFKAVFDHCLQFIWNETFKLLEFCWKWRPALLSFS